jgi:hypothetical protein
MVPWAQSGLQLFSVSAPVPTAVEPPHDVHTILKTAMPPSPHANRRLPGRTAAGSPAQLTTVTTSGRAVDGGEVGGGTVVVVAAAVVVGASAVVGGIEVAGRDVLEGAVVDAGRDDGADELALRGLEPPPVAAWTARIPATTSTAAPTPASRCLRLPLRVDLLLIKLLAARSARADNLGRAKLARVDRDDPRRRQEQGRLPWSLWLYYEAKPSLMAEMVRSM